MTESPPDPATAGSAPRFHFILGNWKLWSQRQHVSKIHFHIPQTVSQITHHASQEIPGEFNAQNIPINLLMQKLKSILDIMTLVLLWKWIENMDQVCAFFSLHGKYISSMAASFELGDCAAVVSTETLGHRLQFAWASTDGLECKYKWKTWQKTKILLCSLNAVAS